MEEGYHRQTDGRTADRQAYRKKQRANKMKHRNQDQIKTNVGLPERWRAKAERDKHKSQKRGKNTESPCHPSCVPKNAKVQKEAMNLGGGVGELNVLGREHLLPEDLATLAFLWTWG